METVWAITTEQANSLIGIVSNLTERKIRQAIEDTKVGVVKSMKIKMTRMGYGVVVVVFCNWEGECIYLLEEYEIF